MKKVYGFIGRIIFGGLIGIYIGGYLDRLLHTKFIMTVVLLLYVIFGSIYILIKESSNEEWSINKENN